MDSETCTPHNDYLFADIEIVLLTLWHISQPDMLNLQMDKLSSEIDVKNHIQSEIKSYLKILKTSADAKIVCSYLLNLIIEKRISDWRQSQSPSSLTLL
ncbi:hypothetical protein DP804_19875 [Salmonella enterica subsp. enterica]|nr:hypothetical protein [Salmonella enterica subsp. enterica serovar Virchow]